MLPLRGAQMTRGLEMLLLADLLAVTLIVATAVPSLMREAKAMLKAMALRLQQAQKARRERQIQAAAMEALEAALEMTRAQQLAQMPGPVPVLVPIRMRSSRG